jgi:tetratricopeptide (TPR) repeat protein
MFWRIRLALLVGLFVLATCAPGQSSRFEQELQAGITDYENGKLAEAIEHLEKAVQLNPGSIKSHFALADACSAQYIDSPNTDSGEFIAANDRLIYRAIGEYKAVLAIEPTNTQALNNIGQIYRRLAKPKDAELYFRESLKIDAKDQEALYWLAVLNWERSYQFRMEKRQTLHLKDEISLIASRGCAAVRSENLERVEEAIVLLNRLSRITNFAAVPAWLSLLYRERADIQCGDPSAYEADIQSANDSVRLACEARATGAEQMPNSWPPPPPPPSGKPCGK